MKNINQGTTENPLASLENLREGLQIYTTTDLKSLKGNEILTHATIRKNLKDMTPNEINQTPKDKYGVISHTGGATVIQVHGDGK